ncbi:MAG: GTP-binding protein [Candidatus Korarchaeota archaeon]|nr:GTP-binding protein [Candidatus Korarchaeota archaeon]
MSEEDHSTEEPPDVSRKKVKIVIMGPSEAGKTTYLRALDDKAVLMVDKSGRTVGMDVGFVAVDPHSGEIMRRDEVRGKAGFFGRLLGRERPSPVIVEIQLVSTPGQERFRWVREALARGVHGAILMVDSSRPDQVGEAGVVYHEIRAILPEVPVVLVANKQDLEGSLSPQEVRDLTGLDELEVFGTSALKGENVEAPLKRLIQLILGRELDQKANWAAMA